ncbi:MAG: PspC domain-containing protein [Actinomycetota bacterium]
MTEPTPPTGRLTRPRQGRILAGVCAAIASRTGVDVGVVRILFVVSLAFGGLGFIAYLAGWALLPEEGEERSPAERMLGSS